MTDGNDVLSKSIWLNSHIKVNNTSPCLKNWIENDIYTIDDVLYQNKQIMNYAFFQDTYHVATTFVEFYGIISAIPRHWRHLINTCHNLIYKENRFIHVTDGPKNHVNISIDSLLIKTHLYL